MPAPIAKGLSAASGKPCHPFDAARCRPGDRIAARIVDIGPSGRTVLSLAGVKAVAMQPLGGRAGDAVLLEVTSRTPPASSASSAGTPSAQPASPRTAPLFEIVVRQNGRTIRLTVLLRATGGHAPSLDKRPPPAPRFSCSHPLNMLGMLQTSPPERALQMAAAWLDAIRQRRQSPKAPGRVRQAEGRRPADQTNLTFSRRSEALEAPVAKVGEQPETASNACCAAGGRPDGIVRFRLKRGAGKSSGAAGRHEFEAVFLLSLDRIGAVRTDLRMGGGRIAVVFFVETEDCRQRFAAAVPDLERDLGRLGGHCRCRVAVSPQKIEALLSEPHGFGASTAFEARV